MMQMKAVVFFATQLGLACALVPWAQAAEIYKWVDANGRTHYGEKGQAAASAKAVEVKVASPAPQTATSPAMSSNDVQALRQRLQPQSKPAEMNARAPAPEPPRSLSGGRIEESAPAKCNLARDVLSGAVRHGNGAPTDAYDRQVAENDVRVFCKK